MNTGEQQRTAGGDAGNRLALLQSMRALAALIVVCDHAFLQYQYMEKLDAWSPIDGAFGVDIFFVISGFIIYYISRDHFSRHGASWTFFIRRCIRIVPLYWAVTTIVFVHVHDLWGLTGENLARSLLFIPYDSHDGRFRPIVGRGWSLNYEMLFYVITSAGLFFSRRLGVTAIFAVILSLIAIGSLQLDMPAPLVAWTRPVMIEFLAGMSLAMLYLAAPRRWSPRYPLACIAVLLTLEGAYHIWRPSGIAPPLGFRPVQWLFALAVVGLAVFGQVETGIHRALATRWLAFLGDCSYSIYLVHGLVLYPAAKLWLKSGMPEGAWVFSFALAVVGTAAGILSYLIVERPLLRWCNSAIRFGPAPERRLAGS